ISDFSQNFHIYRVDWEPGRIVWYVDDVETARVEGDQVSDEQMYLIANLAVGGTFPGPADESTPFPARFEIDYIRVYQR
nr:glycoside hydrolase family 16 protein [Granulosicoccus sp.]